MKTHVVLSNIALPPLHATNDIFTRWQHIHPKNSGKFVLGKHFKGQGKSAAK